MTDGFKGGAHTVAFGVGLVLLAYNMGEWLEHRDQEHAVNCALYGAFCGWEFGRVLKHVKGKCGP